METTIKGVFDPFSQATKTEKENVAECNKSLMKKTDYEQNVTEREREHSK